MKKNESCQNWIVLGGIFQNVAPIWKPRGVKRN